MNVKQVEIVVADQLSRLQGKATARTFGLSDVRDAVDEALKDGYAAHHAGGVANSYGYRADSTTCFVGATPAFVVILLGRGRCTKNGPSWSTFHPALAGGIACKAADAKIAAAILDATRDGAEWTPIDHQGTYGGPDRRIIITRREAQAFVRGAA